ncbi:hypothetical protein F4810DRAFT_668595 [Camillea tinctor]|nr:hypothetical protein F4810DRAFT_668595 [Camillea tinctor]
MSTFPVNPKTGLRILPDLNFPAVPNTRTILDNLLKEAGLTGHSIHDGWECGSGSTIFPSQYLLHHILFEKTREVLDLSDSVLRKHVNYGDTKTSREQLQKSQHYLRYLKAIPQSRKELAGNDWNEVTVFRDALDYQLTLRGDICMLTGEQEKMFLSGTEVTKMQTDQSTKGDLDEQMRNLTVSGGTSGARTSSQKGQASKMSSDVEGRHEGLVIKEDEQLPNSFICSFSKATISEDGGLYVTLSPTRVPFILRTPGGNKVEEARSDGFERWALPSDTSIAGIIEAKRDPMLSEKNVIRIQMQIGAQFFTWIGQHPPEPWEMVGQGKGAYIRQCTCIFDQDAYLAYAKFDDDYVKYVLHDQEGKKDEKDKKGQFPVMTVRMFGPFNINVPEAVDRFATIRNGFLHQRHRAKVFCNTEDAGLKV